MSQGKVFGLAMEHEYVCMFHRSESGKLRGILKSDDNYSNPDNDPDGPWTTQDLTCNKTKEERPSLFYDITDTATGNVFKCSERRVWAHEKEKMLGMINRVVDGRKLPKVIFPDDPNKKPSLKKFLKDRKSSFSPISSWLENRPTEDGSCVQRGLAPLNAAATKELSSIFPGNDFSAPKSSSLVKTFIQQSADENDMVLDYFAGSGTTAHAVINLNREDKAMRKYILVEMGDHFDTVLKPRIQKVVYSADWKDGKPTAPDTGVSHSFKYLRLESYEDALNNLDLGEDRTPDLLGLDGRVREEYLFSYLLDVETRGHLMNLERFRDPWGSQLKIHDPHTGKSEPREIDLVETFNYLLGITVRRLRCRDGFLTVEGEKPGGDTVLVVWRKLEGGSEWPVTTNADLKRFFAETLEINPAKTKIHAIYVNGDHTLEDPRGKIHCIEEIFYERMFEHTGNPED